VSRDKKFQLRVDQDFLDWFDDQIKREGLAPNKSDITITALQDFFKKKRDLRVISLPDHVHVLIEKFASDSSSDITPSDVVLAAVLDYLGRK
jgi:hypothetical protein